MSSSDTPLPVVGRFGGRDDGSMNGFLPRLLQTLGVVLVLGGLHGRPVGITDANGEGEN